MQSFYCQFCCIFVICLLKVNNTNDKDFVKELPIGMGKAPDKAFLTSKTTAQYLFV